MAIEIAMKAKWYHMVTLKIRVSRIFVHQRRQRDEEQPGKRESRRGLRRLVHSSVGRRFGVHWGSPRYRPRPARAVLVIHTAVSGMPKKPLYFEIFTTSLGALLLEIAYTRIFSFKVFYYFTYLILGIGLLGIGAGGIAVATSERLRKVDVLERVIPTAASPGG